MREFFPPRPGWCFPKPDEQLLIGLLSAMVGIAWLLLWLRSASPYGRYLDPSSWSGMQWVADEGQGVLAGKILLPIMFHAGLWLLMCVAMMLPTTLPLMMIWHRLVSRHADRWFFQGLAIAGYLSAWGAFGFVVFGVDAGLHRLIHSTPWFSIPGWVAGVGTFGLAGLFQFSSLKDHCLEQCRSPLSFALAAWQREGLRWQSWWLGVRHGLYCVGCCWALMLLMFVIGMGSFGWMLLLGAVMAAEKNAPWGYRLRKPVGVVLLVGALVVGLSNIAALP